MGDMDPSRDVNKLTPREMIAVLRANGQLAAAQSEPGGLSGMSKRRMQLYLSQPAPVNEVGETLEETLDEDARFLEGILLPGQEA